MTLTPQSRAAIAAGMETRPGFAFSSLLKVRYAEIDGQKVVFNSRYLEYADVAVTDYWEWTGIHAALGAEWREAEFHVRKAEVDYLKPFVLGDEIRMWVRLERIGGTSFTQRIDLTHADTGGLHNAITLVNVNVHLPTGRPVPIGGGVRTWFERLVAEQPAA